MDFSRIIEIDFGRCFKALWNHVTWIIVSMVSFFTIGILVAVFYLDTENVYDAKSSVYSITYGSYADSANGIQAIKTYSDIVKSLRVAERAALLLGDDSLDKFTIYDMIEVDEPEPNSLGYITDDSSIIQIHAYATNKDDAIRVVNAVANAYVMEVTSITNSDSVQVLDEAYTCEITYNALKQQLIYIGIFTVLGILFGCAVIVLIEIFSQKITSLKQGSLYNQLDIIGVIPEQEKQTAAQTAK